MRLQSVVFPPPEGPTIATVFSLWDVQMNIVQHMVPVIVAEGYILKNNISSDLCEFDCVG